MVERPSLRSRHNGKFDDFSEAKVTTDRNGEEIWRVEYHGRIFLGIQFDWVEVVGPKKMRRVSGEMEANLNAVIGREAMLAIREKRKSHLS